MEPDRRARPQAHRAEDAALAYQPAEADTAAQAPEAPDAAGVRLDLAEVAVASFYFE